MKFEWVMKRGIHYLVDEAGRVLAEVRKTATDTYRAYYGAAVVEEYIDFDSARRAMRRKHEELEVAKQLDARKQKEKGDGGKNP